MLDEIESIDVTTHLLVDGLTNANFAAIRFSLQLEGKTNEEVRRLFIALPSFLSNALLICILTHKTYFSVYEETNLDIGYSTFYKDIREVIRIIKRFSLYYREQSIDYLIDTMLSKFILRIDGRYRRIEAQKQFNQDFESACLEIAKMPEALVQRLLNFIEKKDTLTIKEIDLIHDGFHGNFLDGAVYSLNDICKIVDLLKTFLHKFSFRKTEIDLYFIEAISSVKYDLSRFIGPILNNTLLLDYSDLEEDTEDES